MIFRMRNQVKPKKFHMGNFLLLLLLVLSFQVKAVIPVIDATNLAQNIQQVAKSIIQIQNQIQQIKQMAQTLKTIGNSQYGNISGDLNAQLNEMQNTLGTLTQISQSVGAIEGEFRVLFPDENSWATYDYSTHGATLKAWSDEIDNATAEALKAQGITQRVAGTVASVNAILAESKTADGEVRQLQLMNQNIAVLSQQMNDSLQLLAANGRLQAIETARKEKAREAARARKKKMMKNFGTGTYTAPVLTHLP